MGTELFERTGRQVVLTPDGEMFRDAAQLSFTNILQATERLRKQTPVRQALTVCCTPAFASMWLQPRLPQHLEARPDVEITVLATQNFLSMDAGVHGLVLGSGTGQHPYLSETECNQLYAVGARRINGRCNLICQTSALNGEEVLRRSRRAESIGAVGLMVLPPYFEGPTVIKAAQLRGFGTGYVRKPLRGLNAAQEAVLRAALAPLAP